MALDYSWVLLICFGLTVGLTGAVWLIMRNKDLKTKSVALYANTSRLTKSPAYQKAIRSYKLGIISIVTLIAFSGASAAIVAAKPVDVTIDSPVKYNRDIVLCLDVSGSMIYVNKQIIDKFKDLSEGFKGERVSLIVFNTVSNQVFPLTDDYDYILGQLDKVEAGLTMMETGFETPDSYDLDTYTLGGEGSSLIGDGLAACTMGFDKNDGAEKRSQSIILATDNIVLGEQLITLEDAAMLAKDKKITVYAINPEIPLTEVEAKALEEAILPTGGKYYGLQDNTAVPAIIDQITSEQTSAVQGDEVVIKTDVPQVWILLSAFLFVTALGLAWRFRL